MKYKNPISFLILFLLLSVTCFSQSIVNRANSSYTVQDSRGMWQYNAVMPRYADTAAANLQKGIDTCGAIIYLYSTNTFWYRSCAGGTKAWVELPPYTDADARAAISLTTTGTSGAATYSSATGVFNIPDYTGVNVNVANSSAYTGALGSPSVAGSNFFGLNSGSGATAAVNSNFSGESSGFNAANATLSNFFGFKAGNLATNADHANFFGLFAGENATNADLSNFFGSRAGLNATNSASSNFFGANAGRNAPDAGQSNFFGLNAGNGSTNASSSNFFGTSSGLGATGANNSNFFGSNAGNGATGANNSNFFGNTAGFNATNATYSNFFSQSAGSGATNALESNFLGFSAGLTAIDAPYSNFFGSQAGRQATKASNSNFFGLNVGYLADSAKNSIFIGENSGNESSLTYPNKTHNGTNDYSILIGRYTITNGFKNSVLLGGAINTTYISNTADNQFMLAPNITKLRFNSFDYDLAADTLATRAYARSVGGGGGSITQNWFDDDLTLSGVTTKINRADFFDDMLTTPTSTAGTSYMLEFASGTGADASIGNTTPVPNGDGWSVFNTGTTATGLATLSSTSVNAAKLIYDTTKAYRFETKINIETLSDDVEDFRIVAGLTSYLTTTTSTRQIWFLYNDNTNGGNWTCFSSNATTVESTNSTVAAASGTSVILAFEYDNAAVKFYINGSLVATHTTNVPPHGEGGVFPVIAMTKTAGTTSRLMYCDYVKYRKL